MSWIAQREKRGRAGRLLFLFCFTALLLVAGMLMSIKFGQATVSWSDVFRALKFQHHDKTDLYIRTLRLPRSLTACIAGIQLALAGLLTQMATKNPLASPHVFGINAGAALAVVAGLALAADLPLSALTLLAIAGSAAGAVLVWSLSGLGYRRHVHMALAGITIHFLLSALTEAMMILQPHSTDSVMFWLVGSVSNAGWPQVVALLPYFAGGLLLFGLLLPSFRLLVIDDELAAGLGQRVALVRSVALLLVVILAGSAVAVCGPISFICLIVPHIARALAGHRLAVLAPLTALLGGSLLVYADLASRMIAYPYESPVGIVTAAIGAPFFIYLARRNRRDAR